MSGRGTSLRFRLLAGTLVWIVATVGIAGWILQGMFEQHLARQFDNELATHLGQLAAHVEPGADSAPMLTRPLSDPRLERPYSGLYWQVDRITAPGGGAMLRSRSLWDAQLKVPEDQLADGERHTHRVIGPDGNSLRTLEQVMRPAEAPEHAWRLIVAADERLLSEPLDRFRSLLLAALTLLVAGLVAAAVFQVMAGLRPLKRLHKELSSLRDGNRTTLGTDHPSEIQPLVDELNTVLARNAEFVTRARAQAGNLAHAVKTPLAVMANAASEDDPALREIVVNQVGQARLQVDRHLALARVAATAQDRALRCEVLPVLAGLLRLMERVWPERCFNASLPAGKMFLFRGEAEDLQEMLGNLLDNAGKWAKQRVDIRIAQAGDFLQLEIEDDGPGIPPAQRARVLQRGRRMDETMPGAGLGLAIVADLAAIYGGQLVLQDGCLGGLCVRLSLPSSPTA